MRECLAAADRAEPDALPGALPAPARSRPQAPLQGSRGAGVPANERGAHRADPDPDLQDTRRGALVRCLPPLHAIVIKRSCFECKSAQAVMIASRCCCAHRRPAAAGCGSAAARRRTPARAAARRGRLPGRHAAGRSRGCCSPGRDAVRTCRAARAATGAAWQSDRTDCLWGVAARGSVCTGLKFSLTLVCRACLCLVCARPHSRVQARGASGRHPLPTAVVGQSGCLGDALISPLHACAPEKSNCACTRAAGDHGAGSVSAAAAAAGSAAPAPRAPRLAAGVRDESVDVLTGEWCAGPWIVAGCMQMGTLKSF